MTTMSGSGTKPFQTPVKADFDYIISKVAKVCSTEETSSKETSSEETLSKETSSKETSRELTSSEGTSSEVTSSEESSTDETSSEEISQIGKTLVQIRLEYIWNKIQLLLELYPKSHRAKLRIQVCDPLNLIFCLN